MTRSTTQASRPPRPPAGPGGKPDRAAPPGAQDADPVAPADSAGDGDAPAQPAAPGPASSPGSPPAAPRKPFYKRPVLMAVLLVLLVGGVLGGVAYWLNARHFEKTDDAFVEGHVVQISPQVAGHLASVNVRDNEQVSRGQVLAEIDPADYQAKAAQAKAALDVALTRQKAAQINVDLTGANTQAAIDQAQAGVEVGQSAVESANADLASAQAGVVAAEAEATRTAADLKRYRELDAKVISKQALDAAVAAAQSAEAQLTAARTKAASARAHIVEAQARVSQAKAMLAAARAGAQQVAISQSQAATAAAEVEQARAALRQAELDVGYARIVAPEAGRVTRKAMEPGAYVTAGQVLCAVVPDAVWVTGNFKETQLTYMRPGQEVEVKIDAYPHRTFRGKVDSIQSGTGARFSMLPPENATGNYVKVVQRVPVKITFEESGQDRPLLAPGMSAEPTVRVR